MYHLQKFFCGSWKNLQKLYATTVSCWRMKQNDPAHLELRLSQTPRYLERTTISLNLPFQSFTIGYIKLPAISTYSISNGQPFPWICPFSHLLSATSNYPLSQPTVSRTDNHFLEFALSVIYYRLHQTTRYLNLFFISLESSR